MEYYILRQDRSIDGTAAVDALPDGMDTMDWLSGNVMPDRGERYLFLLDKRSGDYRGSMIDCLVTLFHETLKQALDGFGVDNIQYFPATLRDQHTGEDEYGYFLVNILDVCDCVDMEKSKTVPWVTGMGCDFESIVIDESLTSGKPLFRLKEDPTKIVISQSLKDYLEEHDVLVGETIMNTRDYSDW